MGNAAGRAGDGDAGRRSMRAAGGAPGGDGETRTPDPLLAKQVLSQLSYIPGAVQSRRSRRAE